MSKLNLGCGYVDTTGWEAVDILDYGNNTVCDIRNGMPYDDNTFDFVLMNHTLQMFHYDELPVVLKEVMRVMKPEATLRILTPDLDKAVWALKDEAHSHFPIADDLEKTIAGKFARYMFWHGDTRCAFNFWSLHDLLKRNGFKGINLGHYGDCELDSRENESLIVECRK